MTSVISKNIRYLRKQCKMSQQQLADKTGKSESAIQMWESDKRSPIMETVQQLCEIFNIDMNTLVYVDLETGSRSKNGYIADSNMIPSNISSLEEAMRIIVDNPSVAFYGGYDLDKMTDEEKIEFANQIADSIKFFAKRYRK